VAVASEEIVGFRALILEPDGARLDHLWVLPKAMGSGVGRALLGQAETTARAAGATSLRIAGDPHAEALDRRMGANIDGVGTRRRWMGRSGFCRYCEKVLE